MITLTEVPDGATVTLVANTDAFHSTLNGYQQFSLKPGSRWALSLTWTNRKGRGAAALRGQLSSLLGQTNIFKVAAPDYHRYGTASGTPVVVSAPSGAVEINTSGWTASQPLVLAAGDWVEINQQMFQITEDVASSGTGTAKLKVSPPVRRATVAGTSVIVNNPSFYCRLTSATGAEFALSPAAGSPIYAVGVDALEID